MTISDRFTESRAAAEAGSIIRQLDDLALEPSGKKFTHSRPRAAELWGRLETLANARVEAAGAASSRPVKRRAVKPAAVPAPVPETATA